MSICSGSKSREVQICIFRKIKKRLDHIDEMYENYIDYIGLFDHVLLNIGQPEDLIDQMCRIIRHYKDNT